MMRDVFLEIRYDEKQFKHAVPLFRIWLVRSLFEIINNRERIRKQPFEVARGHRYPPAEILESTVRSNEGLVEKMVETKLFGDKAYRNRAGTT
jgi:hypothetical protein